MQKREGQQPAQGHQEGQSTVEYVLVLVAVLSLVLALGALWDVLQGGVLVQHAVVSASHHIQAAALGNVADIFLY